MVMVEPMIKLLHPIVRIRHPWGNCETTHHRNRSTIAAGPRGANNCDGSALGFGCTKVPARLPRREFG